MWPFYGCPESRASPFILVSGGGTFRWKNWCALSFCTQGQGLCFPCLSSSPGGMLSSPKSSEEDVCAVAVMIFLCD